MITCNAEIHLTALDLGDDNMINVALDKSSKAYETVREYLELYTLSGTPILCGWGVEVYQNDNHRMVVDLNAYTLSITIIEE